MNLASSKDDVNQLLARLKSRNSEQRQDVTDVVKHPAGSPAEGTRRFFASRRSRQGADEKPEVDKAESECFECPDPKLLASIRKAGENIRLFHENRRKTPGSPPMGTAFCWGRRLRR